MSNVVDGWEDEDDLDLDDDQEDERVVASTGKVVAPTEAVARVHTAGASSHPLGGGNGWEEDADLDLDFQDDNNEKNKSDTGGDEWSFEDDDIMMEEDDTVTPLPSTRMTNDEESPAQGMSSPAEEELYRSLQEYLALLPRMLPSLNAILEAEYNTYHHAVELASYYQNRPALYEYTVETELSRMDYEVVLPTSSQVVRGKQVRPHHFQHVEPLIVRSANQSLLADVLTVLSGPDAFIRPQFLATAVATSCQFTVKPDRVLAQCTLRLSLPHSSQDRLAVAQLHLSVEFCGNVPSIQYVLHKVDVLGLDIDTSLRETVALLVPLVQDYHDHVPAAQAASNDDDAMRDALLLQLSRTQQMVQAGQVGMASALQQVDAVANVSQKLGFLKNVNLMPSTEHILASSELSRGVTEDAPGSNMMAQPQPAPWRGPPAATAATPSDAHPSSRPAPLLGGLLRSGWSRLAKSVTLPDEPQEEPPRVPEAAFPKLYQTTQQEEEPQRVVHTEQPPQLYRQEEAPSRPTTLQPTASNSRVQKEGAASRKDIVDVRPKEHAQLQDGWENEEDVIVEDGWADDGLEDLEEEDDDNDAVLDRPDTTDNTAAFRDAPSLPVAPLESNEPTTSTAYSPEDDICETRKRWVNPLPGRRRLRT